MFANFPIVFVAARKSLETYPYHRSLRLSSSPLMVQDLYSQRRHEFGDNSISRLLPSSWWANATQEGRREEILGMRDILRKWGNVKAEDVKGYRATYIQVGGNMEFKVLKDEGFLYESSMPTQKFMNPPLWPYTLDYRSIQDCQIPPSPNGMYASKLEVFDQAGRKSG